MESGTLLPVSNEQKPQGFLLSKPHFDQDYMKHVHCTINKLANIVAKKWDPGILDPVPFSGQIRKVEARLGKLAKIRKVETDQESSFKRLGKLEVRPKKRRIEKGLHLILVGILGKLSQIRKVHSKDQESCLNKHVSKIRKCRNATRTELHKKTIFQSGSWYLE